MQHGNSPCKTVVCVTLIILLYYVAHSQDADLPPKGEGTVRKVLAADTSTGLDGRKLTSTSYDSQSGTSAGKEISETSKPSKYSRDDEKFTKQASSTSKDIICW